MDYPFFNFLFGLLLIFTTGVSIGLTFLLAKKRLPPVVWRTILVILILVILVSLYIGYLFSQTMTPAFNVRLGLGVILIGSTIAGLTAFLYRVHFSPVTWRLISFFLVLSLAASFTLAYLLYRSLVPTA
jgi:hypothetical protein